MNETVQVRNWHKRTMGRAADKECRAFTCGSPGASHGGVHPKHEPFVQLWVIDDDGKALYITMAPEAGFALGTQLADMGKQYAT